MKKSLIGYSLEDLTNLLIELNQPKFRAKQIYEWIYSKHVAGINEMSNLPAALRNALSECYNVIPFTVKAKYKSKDGTIKFILACDDNELIETVYIPSAKRRTVCISTQVGCPVKCVFCESGRSGLVRNLRIDEIAGQIAFIAHEFGMMPTNIVVMGMGEPLLNAHFIDALKVITGENFYNLGARHVTVSTSGIVPGIYKLADDGNSQWNLAVSIHVANDLDRAKIIPTASRYSLADIVEACIYYRKKTSRRITFEYTLVKGQNDSNNQAKELASLAKKANAKINLIPLNCTDLENRRPTQNDINLFLSWLEQEKVDVTVRYSKGDDIAAACGQLRNHLNNQE